MEDLRVPNTLASAPRSSIPNDQERAEFQQTGVLTDTGTVTGTTAITNTGITEDSALLTDIETFTATTSTTTVSSQLLLVPNAAREAEPSHPEFEVNIRQSELDEHFLLESPVPNVPLAAQPPLAFDKGPATTVLAMDATADIPVVIVRNHGLNDNETADVTSTVDEPSAAASRDGVVLYTANWFAAISKDDGESFTYLNPAETFPETDGHEFCCDQVAMYDAADDILFWFLQYLQNGTSNKIRIAYAQGEDIRNENWSYYDFTPQTIGGWNNEWFDFPDLALSRDHLYISVNSFATNGTEGASDDRFARAVVLRLPLAQIAADEPVSVEHFDTEQSFSFRLTQGAQDVMYFGSHDFANFGQGIEVYAWPEDSNQISLRRIQVNPWSDEKRESEGPDGRSWLGRADSRMTAAWVQGQEVGFAWTAAQDENFSQPNVRVAIVDMNGTGNSATAQPHLWNDGFAFAYPAVAVNGTGTLGISVAYGGGGLEGINPSHAVGILRKTEAGYTWQLVATDNGDNGPADGRWGDYLSISPHGQDPQLWVATGYTLHNGPLPQNAVPRVVYFREQIAEVGPNEAAQTLAELQAEAEKLRDQIEVLLQKIAELEAQFEN